MPNLPHFIQEALNSRTHNDQSEVEVLLDISSKRAQTDGAPNWAQIEAAASNVSGPCAKYAKVLAAFARVQPPEVIQDLSAFYKAFTALSEFGPNRMMGSEFITKLAATNFGNGNISMDIDCIIQSQLEKHWHEECGRTLQADHNAALEPAEYTGQSCTGQVR